MLSYHIIQFRFRIANLISKFGTFHLPMSQLNSEFMLCAKSTARLIGNRMDVNL